MERGLRRSDRGPFLIDDARQEFLRTRLPGLYPDMTPNERAAIEDWIAKGNGKSPKTNDPMGTTLLPAPQVKAMIRGMVKSGALTGDKAEAWEAKLAEEEKVRATREKA